MRELLDGDSKYRCDKCKAKCSASKKLHLSVLPTLAVIQLGRFDESLQKISGVVAFERELDLGALLHHQLRAQSTAQLSASTKMLWGALRVLSASLPGVTSNAPPVSKTDGRANTRRTERRVTPKQRVGARRSVRLLVKLRMELHLLHVKQELQLLPVFEIA